MSIKGALPIPHIVALILAIIVIAVIVYLFFFHTGIGQATWTRVYCEAMKLWYCFQKPEIPFNEYEPKCSHLGWDVQC